VEVGSLWFEASLSKVKEASSEKNLKIKGLEAWLK
jgi:hypothetical protein